MVKTADRVSETTTSIGTGPVILAGAKPGYSSFASSFSDGDQVYYCITDNATAWETGIGTFSLSALTLTRTTVLTSTNANAAVPWTSGTKDVFCTIPNKYLSDLQDDVFSMSIVFSE